MTYAPQLIVDKRGVTRVHIGKAGGHLTKLSRAKDQANDELRKKVLSLESQLKLQTSEYHNRRKELEQKLRDYETNQEKDLQELKKLRDELK